MKCAACFRERVRLRVRFEVREGNVGDADAVVYKEFQGQRLKHSALQDADVVLGGETLCLVHAANYVIDELS